MSDVTRILSQIEAGDPSAVEQLLPLVYEELRKLAAVKLAHEKPGQTLQATARAHEAYLRLVGGEREHAWDSQGHFFAATAEALRRILLNRARDRQRLTRGGGWRRVDPERIEVALDMPDEDLVALDEAIERLEAEEPLCARSAKLRFFAGLRRGQVEQLLRADREADTFLGRQSSPTLHLVGDPRTTGRTLHATRCPPSVGVRSDVCWCHHGRPSSG